MLLLNHIFSRICCPVRITHMCVQPGWQPAWCPGPPSSVPSWGTPSQGHSADGQDRAEGWEAGAGFGCSLKSLFCRSRKRSWGVSAAPSSLHAPSCALIYLPWCLSPRSVLPILNVKDSQTHSFML
jgi:hypothetical protein